MFYFVLFLDKRYSDTSKSRSPTPISSRKSTSSGSKSSSLCSRSPRRKSHQMSSTRRRSSPSCSPRRNSSTPSSKNSRIYRFSSLSPSPVRRSRSRSRSLVYKRIISSKQSHRGTFRYGCSQSPARHRRSPSRSYSRDPRSISKGAGQRYRSRSPLNSVSSKQKDIFPMPEGSKL